MINVVELQNRVGVLECRVADLEARLVVLTTPPPVLDEVAVVEPGPIPVESESEPLPAKKRGRPKKNAE